MSIGRLGPFRSKAWLAAVSLPLCACSPSADSSRVGDTGSNQAAAVDVAAPEPAATENQSTPIGNAEGSDDAKTDAAGVAPPPSAGRSTTASSAEGVYVAKTRRPAIVLGALRPGRLEVVNGCLTVKLADQPVATAVLPPDARVVVSRGAPSAVTYGSRSLPIGQDTRIPGGGSGVTPRELAAPTPASCPERLFPIGG